MTIEEQITCVKREIDYRRRCYPRWVREERITPEKAQHGIDGMTAVLGTLLSVQEARSPQGRLF